MTTRVWGAGALLVLLVGAANALLWQFVAPTRQVTVDEMAAEADRNGTEFGTGSVTIIGYENVGVPVPAGPHWFPAVPTVFLVTVAAIGTAVALMSGRRRGSGASGSRSSRVWWASGAITVPAAVGFWAISSAWPPRSYGFTFVSPDGVSAWIAANSLFRESMWVYLVECMVVALIAGGAVSAFAPLGKLP